LEAADFPAGASAAEEWADSEERWQGHRRANREPALLFCTSWLELSVFSSRLPLYDYGFPPFGELSLDGESRILKTFFLSQFLRS
jgi:hypothetical protein